MWNKEWYIINRLKIKTASSKWKTKFLRKKTVEEIKAKWGEEELKKIIDDVKNVRRRLKYEEISPYKKYIQLKKEIKAILNTKDILIRKEGEYSVNHEYVGIIKKFLKAGNSIDKWKLIEEREVDTDRKGNLRARTHIYINVIAIGGGYAFIEHFRYRGFYYAKGLYFGKKLVQWIPSIRKNKFVMGFTEEGRIFLKSIPSNIPDQRIKEILSSPNPFVALNEFLTKQKIQSTDIIQGDILLKRIKKIPKKLEMQPTSEYLIGRHCIKCNDMLVRDNYVLLKANGMLVHPEHFPKEIPAGLYKVVKQKSYPIWDFSKSFKD